MGAGVDRSPRGWGLRHTSAPCSFRAHPAPALLLLPVPWAQGRGDSGHGEGADRDEPSRVFVSILLIL